MSWQDGLVALVVVAAFIYVVGKLRGRPRRRRPDVTVKQLLRRRREEKRPP